MTTQQFEITDHDREVNDARKVLRDSLAAANNAIHGARTTLDRLSSSAVYDVEIAEGWPDDIKAALMQASVGIAAAQHLTRAAQPFIQPA